MHCSGTARKRGRVVAEVLQDAVQISPSVGVRLGASSSGLMAMGTEPTRKWLADPHMSGARKGISPETEALRRYAVAADRRAAAIETALGDRRTARVRVRLGSPSAAAEEMGSRSVVSLH